MHVRALRLCLVTNIRQQPFSSYKPLILKAIQGGVTSVQLRAKTQSSLEFYHLALQIKKTLRPFGVPLIINDHVEIARDIDAEGAHIGQTDLTPQEARQILGTNKIIGWSVETLHELEQANQLSCIDYIAASAVFPSKTKTDCKTIWGIAGLQQVARLSKHPVMAIGGINVHNIDTVIASGACGAAVIGAIHDHHDPQNAAARLITKINQLLDQERALCLRK